MQTFLPYIRDEQQRSSRAYKLGTQHKDYILMRVGYIARKGGSRT